MDRTHSYFLCWIIIALGTAVRLAAIAGTGLDLAPDEAQYWDWSRTLQLSYYSKGPLIAWWIALWTHLFGDTVFGVRFGAVVGSVLLQLLWWWWADQVWRRPEAGPWILIILNTTLFFTAGSILMTTDNLLLVGWSAASIFLHRILTQGRGYICLAFAMAFGLWAKYTMLAFVPVAAWALWRWHRSWGLPPGILRPLGVALVFGTVAGLAPVLLWNIQHEWVGLKHVLYRGAVLGPKASRLLRLDAAPEFLASQIALLTPWWAYFLVQGLRGRAQDPAVDLGRSLFWPVFGFFFLWSFHTKVEANWAVAAYVGGLIPTVWSVCQARGSRIMRWIVGGGLGLVAMVSAQAWYPMAGPVLSRLVGWRELGLEVGRQMDTIEGPAFAFAEEYGVTAELSFYVPGQGRAYCLDTGRKRNQYDLWPGPEKGFRGAVFVVRGEQTQAPGLVSQLFDYVGPPQRLQTRRGWVQGQTFTLFVCQGYRGVWPLQSNTTY
jgi:4-amino-4-deoxy-L-arabinose transferase-like glycosyltransferase